MCKAVEELAEKRAAEVKAEVKAGAKTMLKDGISVLKVVEYTKLPLDVVMELQASL